MSDKTTTLNIRLQSIVGDKNILFNTINTKIPGFQIAASRWLPTNIHYELYKCHIEFHIEENNNSLISFFHKELLNDELFEWTYLPSAIKKTCYRVKKQVNANDIENLANTISLLYNKVNPTVEKYLEYIFSLTEIASEFSGYYTKEKEKLPFHINIIDELRADENAHSRILAKLLKYKINGQYILLDSFLNRINSEGNAQITFQSDNLQIECNKECIDILIEEKNNYGIIIENKIHYAADQLKQADRYIERVLSHGIKCERIWFIYLTRDGSKKIDEKSLSPENKKQLGNRFIELNYRYHILPWMKEEILPNCILKEEWLNSALKQYIDHLEGLFGLRSSEKEMQKSLEKYILDKIEVGDNNSIRSLNALKKQIEDIEILLNEVRNTYTKTEYKIMEPFIELTKEVYQELGVSPIQIILRDGYIQLRPLGWSQYIHYEWIPISPKKLFTECSYRFDFHIEGNNKELIKFLNQDAEIHEIKNKIGDLNPKPMKTQEIFFSREYSTSSQKPFYSLSTEDQKNFLKTVYEETCKFIKIIEKYI